jgi:hypothetical protein
LALCTGHLKEAKELGRLGARRAFYFFIADNLAVSTGDDGVLDDGIF